MWVRIENVSGWAKSPAESTAVVFEGFRVCPCVRTQDRPDTCEPRFVGFDPGSSPMEGCRQMKWWALKSMEKGVPTKSPEMYRFAEHLGWDAGNLHEMTEHRDPAADYIESLANKHPLRLVWYKDSDEHGGTTDLELARIERESNNKAAAMVAGREETE